jgi:hypothetical protein
MDVTSIQEAFDRVSKKQKMCYSKTQDVIDRTLHEVEAAAERLNGIVDYIPEARKGVLTDLQLKLTEIGPSSEVGERWCSSITCFLSQRHCSPMCRWRVRAHPLAFGVAAWWRMCM